MKSNIIIALCLSAVLTSSCGTTLIHFRDARPDTSIYVNGKLRGTGQTVRIPRTGIPKSISIEARELGKTVAYEGESRKFTVVTLLLAGGCYGTGLIFAWQYPKEIFLVRPQPFNRDFDFQNDSDTPSDSSPRPSPWDSPPHRESSSSPWENPSKK